MKIRNPDVCDMDKSSLKSNKPSLVVEHVFPLTGFVGLSAHATLSVKQITVGFKK